MSQRISVFQQCHMKIIASSWVSCEYNSLAVRARGRNVSVGLVSAAYHPAHPLQTLARLPQANRSKMMCRGLHRVNEIECVKNGLLYTMKWLHFLFQSFCNITFGLSVYFFGFSNSTVKNGTTLLSVYISARLLRPIYWGTAKGITWISNKIKVCKLIQCRKNNKKNMAINV